MPRWAAPKATKVATSNERTRMMSRSAWLVAKRSWRASGSAKARSGSIPAADRSGAASSRMRPLGTARISFSLASLSTTSLQNANARPGSGRSSGRMGGLPRGWPRLPDIPQMARKPLDFQPYGAVGGEAKHRQARLLLGDRQQLQHPIGLLERDPVMVDGPHRVENQGRMGPPVACLNGRVRLPAEAVEQENKTALGGEERAVAHRHQRILHGGRNDAEVVGVERRELELAVHDFCVGDASTIPVSSRTKRETFSGARTSTRDTELAVTGRRIIPSAARCRRRRRRAFPRGA